MSYDWLVKSGPRSVESSSSNCTYILPLERNNWHGITLVTVLSLKKLCLRVATITVTFYHQVSLSYWDISDFRVIFTNSFIVPYCPNSCLIDLRFDWLTNISILANRITSLRICHTNRILDAYVYYPSARRPTNS